MGSFMPTVVKELNTTNTAFALYFTFLNITLMIGQPLAQVVMKKFDIRLCASFAVTFSCAAVALMSLYTSIFGWYFSAILNGLGLSFITYLLFPIILGNWFKKKIGTVLGIASCMSGLGGSLWTANVGRWITNYGYKNAYLICAAIGWIIAMPFCIFGLRTHPKDKGLKAYGADEIIEIENSGLAEDKGFTMVEALRTPYFYMLLIAVLCIHFMGTFQNQITNFAASLGFPIVKASIVSSCLLFGAVVGKICLGWIHDKFGITITWATAIGSVLVALILFVFGGGTTLIVFTGGFIFGCGYALMGIGSPLLIRNTLG
jgi:MFS family permease